jgi:ParB-like chromosome segregation protein Spo0J
MVTTTKTAPQPVQSFPVDSIRVPDNWRTLDVAHVESLAQSIAEVGLLHPITITPDGTLVAVLHRLEAVRLLGWDAIPVRVVDRDPLHQELITIDEARHGGKWPTGARVFLPAPHGRRAGRSKGVET